jgi:hypothetical protein
LDESSPKSVFDDFETYTDRGIITHGLLLKVKGIIALPGIE